MAAPKNSDASAEAHRQLPDQKTFDEAGEFLIKDEQGQDVPFKTLYADKPAVERQVIVFIRHFFCGNCEEYVRALAADLPPAKLAAANTTLTLIGCGDQVCVPEYKQRTNCPYPIYIDPKQQIYKKLGMMSTLRHAPQIPKYMTKSMFSIFTSSLKNGVTSGSKALKAGPPAQNGGEWLIQSGEVKFAHRMRNTQDHVEIEELKQVLGIE